VDSGRVIHLTGGTDWTPVWSPDGRKIAFERNANIGVVNADGSGLTRLNTGTGSASEPVWSPDSSFLAYNASAGFLPDTGKVCVIAAAGSSTPICLSQDFATPGFSSLEIAWRP